MQDCDNIDEPELLENDDGDYFRVMVIDSNQYHREWLAGMLRRSYFEVVEEKSAKKARKTVMSGRPWFVHIILTEIVGLDIYPFEFLKSISGCGIPIIVLTECKDAVVRAQATRIPRVMEYKEKHATTEWIEYIRAHMCDYMEATIEGSGRGWTPDKRKSDNNIAIDLAGSNPVFPANKKVKVTTRVIWTADLHRMLVDAVNQLERQSIKATAAKVLKLMVKADPKVSVTREHVASHIQHMEKCRNKTKELDKEGHSGGGAARSQQSGLALDLNQSPPEENDGAKGDLEKLLALASLA